MLCRGFFALVFLLFSVPLFAEEKFTLSTNGVEIKFSGLTQIWGTTSFSKEKTFGSDPITFRLRRSELKFSGNIEGEKIGWLVMLDPAARPSEPLQDLYISLNYIPKTEFRFGQFKFPLSMEGLASTGQLDFAERALVVRTFADKRDIGAMLSGKFNRWEWQAGAFNGNGQNKTDDNNFKNWVGRVVIKPTNSVNFGASGYWGKEMVFFDEVRGGYVYRIPRNDNRFRVAGELKIDYKKLAARAEAIWVADECCLNIRTFTVGGTYYRWGGYSTLLYKFLEKHQFAVRAEWFNPYFSGGRDNTFITTLGYNFFFSPRAKWQFNLQSLVEQQGDFENKDTYFVLTNLQVSF